MARNLEFLSWLSMVLLPMSFACQTLPKKPPTLPAALLPNFSICFPAENSAQVKVRQKGELLVHGELDYAVTKADEQVFDLVTPVGSPLVHLERKKQALLFSSNVVVLQDEIRLSKSGFVEIAGHEIAVTPLELCCFLQGRVPRAWSANLVSLMEDQGAFVLHFEQPERFMEVKIPVSRSDNREICSHISWGGVWGLGRRHIQACWKDGKMLTGQMQFPREIALEWVDHHG